MSNFEERLKASLSPAYDIERELEGAGMSRVFVATDRGLSRRVVIKVLPPDLTAGVNRERFRREVQVAAQLQHPHIVTLLSAGEDGDIVYYTMPFIEGESLRSSLEKGPLSVREVVRILHDVVDALAYAHARGVIHRDIKPGNILKLGQHALVTDFGVAKALNAAMHVSGITTAGMAIGTPAYMAPEQLAGDPAADHRIDIYAVGLLAYELLTGESPFTGPSPQATMAAQLTRDPEPLYVVCPDVPPPLSAIIMQCLSKDPANRPPSAEALMTALDSITTSSGDVKSPTTPILPAVSQRRRRLTIAAGVATVALGSAVVLFASQRGDEPRVMSVSADSAARVAVSETAAPAVAAAAAKAEATAPVPVVLTRQDSLAIAEAVRQRLAKEEAVRGKQQVTMFSDSITALVRRVAIDSIIKATLPRGMAIPRWSETPIPATPPVPPSTSRRVVVAEPRETRREELNVFGRTLSDSIRRSLARRRGYQVVDADSVSAVLRTTRSRADIERMLSPDLIITPTFAGVGDTMTVLVTMRDLKNPHFGMRVASGKFQVGDPDKSIPALIKLVGAQLDNLGQGWNMRVAPAPRPRGGPDRVPESNQ
jgi:serine/threonine-protein kinase